MSRKWRFATSGRLGKEFANYLNDNFKPEKISAEYISKNELNDISDFNAYAGFNPPKIDISNLEWIHCFGAGVDGYTARKDLSHATRLTRTSGVMGRKIAEYCLNHILSDNLNNEELRLYQKNRVWKRSNQKYLNETTVVILGTGTIGSAISSLLKKLDINVIGINTSGKALNIFDKVLPFSDIDNVSEISDFVINALPWSASTDNLLDIDFFSKFKDIHFINVGRGKTTRDNVIIEALEKGFMRYATLDVVENEPLPDSSLHFCG